MRAKMVRKIFLIHLACRMREETLFLSVYIMDKYLSIKSLTYKEIDLFLATILFISAKYEETIYVKLSRILYEYKSRLEPCQIIQLESEVLASIDFKLNLVCPYDFLKRIFLIHKIEDPSFSDLKSFMCKLLFRSYIIFRKVS